MITHGSTFSGIGAPEIAAEMLGWENVFHCEINPFGRKILDYYFPNAKSYEDITKTDFFEWRGKVTVLTGGFPCQPFSYAGKRKGSEDDRYLWPFMLRCIEQVKPTWFVGENVAGITTMVFPSDSVGVESETDLFGEGDPVFEQRQKFVLNEIIQNLESKGYEVQPFIVPACAVGAPHRRDRIFIVAHLLEDTMRLRQLDREYEESWNKWNKWNTGSRDGERICREEMAEPTSDTDSSKSRCRRTRSNEGKSKDEGLQERDTIQQSIESISIRQQMEGIPSDSTCDGSRTQEEGDRPIGGRGNNLSQSRQRRNKTKRSDGLPAIQGASANPDSNRGREVYQHIQSQFADGAESVRNGRKRNVANADGRPFNNGKSGIEKDNKPRVSKFRECLRQSGTEFSQLHPDQRWRAFPSVSPVYRGNDGFPFDVDSLTIPFSQWKCESLKAYGNAIVPQVMYEIFRMIDIIENSKN